MPSLFKSKICKKIFLLCSFVFLIMCSISHAKVHAKNMMEGFVRSLVKDSVDPNVSYKCDGDEDRATCDVSKIVLDNGMNISNLKISANIGYKDATFTLSSDVDMSLMQEEDANLKDFTINKLECRVDYNLNDDMLDDKFKCKFGGSAYTFKVDGNLIINSQTLNNKEMDEVLEPLFEDAVMFIGMFTADDNNKDELNKKDYKFLLKNMSLNLNGPKLGEKVFSYMKTKNPSLTKEQYNTQMNMTTLLFPAMLAQNAGVTPQITQSATQIATAMNLLLTSQKQSVNVTLKRKNVKATSLQQLIKSKDTNFIDILKNYDITVGSK